MLLVVLTVLVVVLLGERRRLAGQADEARAARAAAEKHGRVAGFTDRSDALSRVDHEHGLHAAVDRREPPTAMDGAWSFRLPRL